jgi:hypothetical protein
MKNKFIAIPILLGTLIWQASCRSGRQEDCARHIQTEIHTGVPAETAEAALKKCGFTTTMDPTDKSLYGDKRVEHFPITERTQVLIKLDADNRVASVTVSTGLIGP